MTLVSFFHRFIGPPPPATREPRDLAAYPRTLHYLSPPLDRWVRSRRFARGLDASPPLRSGDCGVRLLQCGAHAAVKLDHERFLWSAWLTAEIESPPTDVGRASVQSFLATAAAWRPLFPGFTPAELSGRDDDRPATLATLMATCLPGELPREIAPSLDRVAFDDRLCVLAAVDVAAPDDPESLRAWADVDPPSGSGAGSTWSRRWLSGRVYDRWSAAGTTLVFTHHSCVCFAAAAPPWLRGLFRPRDDFDGPPSTGAYFDLALLAFAEAALDAMSRGGSLAAHSSNDREVADASLQAIRSSLVSVSDQGRAMLGVWRRAMSADLRGLDTSDVTDG